MTDGNNFKRTFGEQVREHFLFVLQSDHGFTGDPDHKVFYMFIFVLEKFEPLVGYMNLMYRQFLETVSRSLSKKMSNLSQRAIKSKTGFLIVEL